jgi:hypothetical protein
MSGDTHLGAKFDIKPPPIVYTSINRPKSLSGWNILNPIDPEDDK